MQRNVLQQEILLCVCVCANMNKLVPLLPLAMTHLTDTFDSLDVRFSGV